jgi:hypothetical protein
MSARAIRRAAERKALKQARKAGIPIPANSAHLVAEQFEQQAEQFEQTAQTFAATADCGFNEPSEARLAANRANAQHSTGPKTEEGKAKSSLNAVKTGLTGRTVLLPADDAIIYQQHLDRNFREFAPGSDREHALVQIIADAEWRLLRIHPLEASLWALGLREFAAEFADIENQTDREALINGKILQAYKKDFSNLALQERRLRNHRKQDIAELKQLQQERAEKEKKEKEAVKASSAPSLGFDFSTEELEAYHRQNDEQRPLTGTHLSFKTFLAAAYRNTRKEPNAA